MDRIHYCKGIRYLQTLTSYYSSVAYKSLLSEGSIYASVIYIVYVVVEAENVKQISENLVTMKELWLWINIGISLAF